MPGEIDQSAATGLRPTERATTVRTSYGSALPGPATLPALLRLLGMNREPLSQQIEAVKAWLAHNTVSSELMVSLLANGFGLLVKADCARSA